jgi:hypothetical protein
MGQHQAGTTGHSETLNNKALNNLSTTNNCGLSPIFLLFSCIALTERLHHPASFSLWRGDQQVYVIGHEYIGVNLAFCFIRVLFKPIPRVDILFIGRAIVTALNEVLAA